MELWLDTVNLNVIKIANELGILKGVTTNPSLLAACQDVEATLISLLEIQDGPITCQVTVSDAEGMTQQGLAYEKISERIIVKVPVTQEGLKAIHSLAEREIDTMATVIFDYRQYLLAAKAGASYAAPYFSSIQGAGKNAEGEFERMCNFKQRYGLNTKILAASLQDLQQLETCLKFGVDAVTLKDDLFLKFIEDNPLTLQRVTKFQEAWHSR